MVSRCDQYRLGLDNAVQVCCGLSLAHAADAIADTAAKVYVESACAFLLHSEAQPAESFSLPLALENAGLDVDVDLQRQLLAAQRTACALASVRLGRHCDMAILPLPSLISYRPPLTIRSTLGPICSAAHRAGRCQRPSRVATVVLR